VFIHRAKIIGQVCRFHPHSHPQGDREGAPVQYTRRWCALRSYIVRAHPRGRPGAVLSALPLVLLALLLAACGGGTTAKPIPSPTPDRGPQLLAKAGLALNTAKTLHALLDIGVTGSGVNGMVNTEVWNEAPNKDRTVVLQSTLAQMPAGEIMVSNGQQVWQYDPAKKVVYSSALNGASSGNSNAGQDTNQFLFGLVRSVFAGSDATLVSASASVKGHAVYDVHIEHRAQANGTPGTGSTPGASGAQFNYSGEVYLDKTSYLPVEVVLTIQGFGQATIDLPMLALNQPVDEKLFTFVPPAGVKVLPFPQDTGQTGALALAQAQQQAGYHLLSIPTSQATYALQTVDALGAPGNQIYTLNYLYNGSTTFAISEGKALANLPTSGQAVRVRGTSGTIATVGDTTTLTWTENGVGVQIAGVLSSAQLTTIAGLLA
jgi:outer membrane lipoprotein-sorting protein